MYKLLTNKFIKVYLLIYFVLITVPILAIYVLDPFGNNKCIKGNCKNGYGVYIYNSGMKYEGEWKDGKRHGKGTLIYLDGTRYEGEWKNNRMDGFGIKTSPVFRAYKYIGEWKNGHKYGKGVQYYSPWEWYDGEWKNGLKHGHGVFVVTLKDGTIKKYYKGIWKDNQLIRKDESRDN